MTAQIQFAWRNACMICCRYAEELEPLIPCRMSTTPTMRRRWDTGTTEHALCAGGPFARQYMTGRMPDHRCQSPLLLPMAFGQVPQALGFELGALCALLSGATGGCWWPVFRHVFCMSRTAMPGPSLSDMPQEPQAQAHCMTVGEQLNSHFFARKMGPSNAPYPCSLVPLYPCPIMATHLKNQRIPLLCVTDHSRDHTEAWDSLTPTRGATPKRGKSLPGACPAH